MPTLPNLAFFCCETCGRQLTTDERMGTHLIPWKRRLAIEPNGCCSACHGDSWTVSVVYSQTSTDIGPTMAGVGLAVVTGVGFSQTSTSSNQTEFPNIPAAVVAKLNEDPSSRMHRISEFVSAMERQRVIERGAKECLTCEMLFVPVADKPWSLAGYCSKSCFVRGDEDDSEGTTRASGSGESGFRPTVQVQCEQGHRFEVLGSFRGMLRPCPQCGVKTRVPNGQS
jgi:hypothetical protein